MSGDVKCNLCGSSQHVLVERLTHKPAGETDFGIADYKRDIYRCGRCDVFFNSYTYLPSDFYTGTYNLATYHSNLLEKYQRIRQLPHEKSDNKQRVRRILHFLGERRPADISVLDVGSGLCVFGGELKDLGFTVYCIDPDPRAIEHALAHAQIDGGHTGTLDNFESDRTFDLITFNKVLEHIGEPIRQIELARRFLRPGGILYIELPDGEAAARQGGIADREEFYIEHLTIFTPRALQFLAAWAGLICLQSASIHEPSDKYTLYGFYQVG